MAVLSNPVTLVPATFTGVGTWPLNGGTVLPFSARVSPIVVKAVPPPATGGTTPPSYYWS